jgi:hypothetical protein
MVAVSGLGSAANAGATSASKKGRRIFIVESKEKVSPPEMGIQFTSCVGHRLGCVLLDFHSLSVEMILNAKSNIVSFWKMRALLQTSSAITAFECLLAHHAFYRPSLAHEEHCT